MADDDISLPYEFIALTTAQSAQVNANFALAYNTINGKASRGGVNIFTGNNQHSGSLTISGAATLTGATTVTGAATFTQAVTMPDTFTTLGGSPPVWTSATTVTIPTGCYGVDATTKERIVAASDLAVVITTTGANGRDAGSETANTKYYLWLCKGASGICGLLSTSATAPTLPTGYAVHKALLPVLVYNNSSSDILSFNVHSWTTGNAEVTYKALAGATVSTTFNPGAVWTNLAVDTFLPAYADFVRLNISAPSACTMLFSTTGATFGTEFQVGVNASFLLPTPFIALNGSLQIQSQSNVSQTHTVYVAGYRSTSW